MIELMVSCGLQESLSVFFDWLSSLFDAKAFFDWFLGVAGEGYAGYWFVFIFMVIESSFVPFPSELVVPPAAWLATNADSHSEMSVPLIVVVATVGALVGSLINYYLALWLGRPVVYKFANSRMGHFFLIDQAKVEKSERYFDDHGAASTFFGRLIPAVRQLISIPAGLARMQIGKFCLYTCLGAAIWNTALALLGAWLGNKVTQEALMDVIEKYNSYFTWVGLGIGALVLAYMLWNAFRTKKTKTQI